MNGQQGYDYQTGLYPLGSEGEPMKQKKKKMNKTRKYRCPVCGEILLCASAKQWIKTTCEKAGRYVRLQLVKEGKK